MYHEERLSLSWCPISAQPHRGGPWLKTHCDSCAYFGTTLHRTCRLWVALVLEAHFVALLPWYRRLGLRMCTQNLMTSSCGASSSWSCWWSEADWFYMLYIQMNGEIVLLRNSFTLALDFQLLEWVLNVSMDKIVCSFMIAGGCGDQCGGGLPMGIVNP